MLSAPIYLKLSAYGPLLNTNLFLAWVTTYLYRLELIKVNSQSNDSFCDNKRTGNTNKK